MKNDILFEKFKTHNLTKNEITTVIGGANTSFYWGCDDGSTEYGKDDSNDDITEHKFDSITVEIE